MKSFVVLSSAVVIAGTSIAALWQIDKKSPQVAGFFAVLGNAGPSIEGPVSVDPATTSNKAAQSASGIEKRLLVAALAGSKRTNLIKQNSDEKKAVASVNQHFDADTKKADEKLLASIIKKAAMTPDRALTSSRKAIGPKKTIGYGVNNRSLVAADPKGFSPRAKIIPKQQKSLSSPDRVALLTKKERQGLGRLVEDKKLAAIDLIIEFDYNSAKLSDTALPLLDKIGVALTDGKLADATFVIAGHTDSVGGHNYNMNLSSQRAGSVRQYLQKHHNIDGKRLVAVGYGEERLKNTHDPKASENRRVEFINLIR